MNPYFIDISHYQSDLPHWPIDWTRVKAAGIQKAYLKATESNNFIDPKFESHRQGAKSVSIDWGAYHFFRGNVVGKLQAAKFFSVVGADSGDLPPAVDIELASNGITRAVFTTRLRECLLELEALYGRKPVIYTSAYLWGKLTTQPAWISEYQLWLSAPDASVPPLPAGATSWWVHQYSWAGQINGIDGDVDLDRENVVVPEPPADVAVIRLNANLILGELP